MVKKRKIDRVLAWCCLFALVFAFSSCGKKDGKTDDESESESASESESQSDTETETFAPTEEDLTPKKRVAFTFDDGPHPVYTKRIVDTAVSHGGQVTFFIVGNMLARGISYADAFLYALNAGCEVGIHSYTHLNNYDECDEETFLSELSRTLDAAKACAPDFQTALMRPVGGRISEAFVTLSPYAVVKWNVDTRDWERQGHATEEAQEANVELIVQEIVTKAQDGSIILMHDLYENTAIAFERAAEILADEGYEFVTVSELLGDDLQAGKVFSKGKPIPVTEVGGEE